MTSVFVLFWSLIFQKISVLLNNGFNKNLTTDIIVTSKVLIPLSKASFKQHRFSVTVQVIPFLILKVCHLPTVMHPFLFKVFRYKKALHRGATNAMSTQSKMENSSINQPSSQQTRWSSETMTSHEKEHYKRALKEIYDAVKLRTQRLESESGSDRDSETEGI